jgi:branched-chain amino acid transport system substrate-binding protein
MVKKLNRRKFLKIATAVLAVLPLFGSPASAEEPKEIKVGFTLSQSGPYSIGAQHSQMTNYVMWAEEVNARGGIFIKKLGKRLPVRLIHYDDRSNIETAVRFYEKLATKDKVDLMLPPWGSAMNFAVASIADRYGYPLIGVTVTSMRLKKMALKNFFAMIQQPDAVSKAIVDFLASAKKKANLKSVGMVNVSDLFGVEFAGESEPLLREKGFEIVMQKSYPLGVKDLTSVLKELKAKNVDVFIGHSYPGDSFLLTAQAQGLGFDPKVFYAGVGPILPKYEAKFGSSINGVLGPGAWNQKVPFEGSKEYYDRFVKRWKMKPDHWGGPLTWASLQCIEQAIAKVGGLDRKKITQVLQNEKFSTIVGPIKFTNGFNLETPGMVLQWQQGVYEIVWPKERATAEPIVPKPAWKTK